jgi:uncharacterized protein YqcC (DUF446 family)
MQIESIEHAMKNAGVWSQEIPEWVQTYSHGAIPNIWEWLQFIYLPLRSNGTLQKPHYLALILSPYMNAAPEYRNILQLVIELDSLSPTIQKN